MGQLDDVEAKVDWCVTALKHLLQQLPAAWEPVTTVSDHEEDPNEAKALEAHLDEVRTVQPSKPVCEHRQQAIVKGQLRCAVCGYDYGVSTGPNAHVQS